MSVSDRQLANAQKLVPVVEQDEENKNEFAILGKPYVMVYDPKSDCWVCKNPSKNGYCLGWLNCTGDKKKKQCKHIIACKLKMGLKVD